MTDSQPDQRPATAYLLADLPDSANWRQPAEEPGPTMEDHKESAPHCKQDNAAAPCTRYPEISSPTWDLLGYRMMTPRWIQVVADEPHSPAHLFVPWYSPVSWGSDTPRADLNRCLNPADTHSSAAQNGHHHRICSWSQGQQTCADA